MKRVSCLGSCNPSPPHTLQVGRVQNTDDRQQQHSNRTMMIAVNFGCANIRTAYICMQTTRRTNTTPASLQNLVARRLKISISIRDKARCLLWCELLFVAAEFSCFAFDEESGTRGVRVLQTGITWKAKFRSQSCFKISDYFHFIEMGDDKYLHACQGSVVLGYGRARLFRCADLLFM